MKAMKTLLKGVGASSGKARGKVRIVSSPSDFTDFEEGDVLVTRLTDPKMTILMNKAAAIVCDIGGVTSHPAIVSREMGIPCVVATRDATKLLKNGQAITVDGDGGVVLEE
jgi:pyruvate,water dikinase